MTILKHELRQGRVSFAIWTLAIGMLMAVCIFLFPEMQGQMESVNEVFASMGAFTAAFGMDQLNFGTLTGFYAVECGNILGLGGAFYTALQATDMLCKEEKLHTAEFLLTHPIRRRRVVTEKLAALLVQVLGMNLILLALSVGSICAIGEAVCWQELCLLHLAHLLLQVELTGLCFGISAFLRHASAGLGLGIAVLLYFLKLVANITESADFLNYITPFGYADGADIMTSGQLDLTRVLLGMACCLLGIAAAYRQYCGKDIHG